MIENYYNKRKGNCYHSTDKYKVKSKTIVHYREVVKLFHVKRGKTCSQSKD